MKKAYHKLALEAHPDKIAGFDKMSDEEKKPFTARFQDIGEAYEVLKDAELRAKYDRGEDVFENQGNGGGGGNPFQHFFHNQGGGGGGQHTFHFG
jgi:DnaJ family protein C protein 3